jgi:hypothetical protein
MNNPIPYINEKTPVETEVVPIMSRLLSADKNEYI